jgi:hypothetical protein
MEISEENQNCKIVQIYVLAKKRRKKILEKGILQ